ncbi:TadE/TadG family type IV pilus assembly protein [Promicromonospora sp. MS192]|uniref:TadE/TadG family type IV pilus assembly protein n=1 Tax=Promicromonospora sp. MS192 TaxID=3412684 RepID=UPI003C2B6B27
MRATRALRERGSTSVQVIILMPFLVAATFLGIQATLISHARSVALDAATLGARTAATEFGIEADGVQAATGFLAQVGDRALPTSSVTVTRTATTAHAWVTGTAQTVLPWWTPHISQHSTATVERLTAGTGP